MKPSTHSGPFKRTIPVQHQPAGAFTLLELLAVLGTLAVLALMMLPVLAGTKTDTRRLQCQANLKQLLVGFQLFTEDHNNMFPPAGWAGSVFPNSMLTWDSWINHYIGGNGTDANLAVGALTSSPSILVCPSDTFPKVSWVGGNNPFLSLRSYAMNAAGTAFGSSWQVSDNNRTYPLPDLGAPDSGGPRHGVGIYWSDSTPSANDWNARGYKTSVVRDPAGTILLCENTEGQQIAGNIWNCVCLGPQSASANALYQTDPNTVQQNPASSTGVNQGNFLYQAQQNSFNYAFHDGHVAPLSIQQTIGSGTLASPLGIWTVAPGD
jgi:prepilin-type processing-associated H-X9-DG protein